MTLPETRVTLRMQVLKHSEIDRRPKLTWLDKLSAIWTIFRQIDEKRAIRTFLKPAFEGDQSTLMSLKEGASLDSLSGAQHAKIEHLGLGQALRNFDHFWTIWGKMDEMDMFGKRKLQKWNQRQICCIPAHLGSHGAGHNMQKLSAWVWGRL